MATYIDNSVLVAPIVILSFRGERLSGSASDPADEKYRYIIANESVRAFAIHATIGNAGDKDARTFTLSRRAQNKQRYYDDDANAYLLPAVAGKDLEDLLVANDSKRLALSMDFEIDYCLFSEYILRYVARESDDGGEFYNMAYPVPGEEVKKLDNELITITHSAKDFGAGHRSTTTYKIAKDKARILSGVKCSLLEKQVDNSDPKKPKVTLSIDVSLSSIGDKDLRRRAQRMFLAADHYKLIKFATDQYNDDWPFKRTFQATAGSSTKDPPLPDEEPTYDVSGWQWSRSTGSWVKGAMFTQYLKEGKGATPMEKSLRIWRKNLYTYFVNYVDVARGERIRQKLIAKAKTLALDPKSTQASLVKAIRDEVDKYLITANHWNGSRELYRGNLKTRDIENHQHILSDTFGEIHTRTFFGGSPVCYVREIAGEALYWDVTSGSAVYSGSRLHWLKVHAKDWTAEQQTAYCLQMGAGHCGEHSMVCYSVMVEAMDSDPNVMAKAVNIVRSGNASIDHAFCIVGMKANTIWHDVRTKDYVVGKKVKRSKGEEVVIWDLKEAIEVEGQDGVVMDAYLGDMQRFTASALLKKIQQAPEKTHYVSFQDQYPLTGTDQYPTTSDPDPRTDF